MTTWLTGYDFRRIFKVARRADVKVQINGQLVPIRHAGYSPISDCYEITPDQQSEDYRIATAVVDEPHDHETAAFLKAAGLPEPDSREFLFHDYSGTDLVTAFEAGYKAGARQLEPREEE